MKQYTKATECYFCHRPFSKTDKNLQKVRDHCHLTGEYRGPAHNSCNLSARTNYDISVFVHNLKGYDAHLIIQEIEDFISDKRKISVIANNTEKYISFKLGNLVFKDSLQFLSCSLDVLSKNLSIDELCQTRKLSERLGVDLDLLRTKGIYPYQWVDSTEQFNATQLPV